MRVKNTKKAIRAMLKIVLDYDAAGYDLDTLVTIAQSELNKESE